MNVRCFRCGWSFSLGRDFIAAALTDAGAAGVRHYDHPCPRCRQVLKISVDQLRRAMPPGWAPPTPEAQAVTPAPPAAGAQVQPTVSPPAGEAQSQAASPTAAPAQSKRVRKRGPARPAAEAAPVPESEASRPADRTGATRK